MTRNHQLAALCLLALPLNVSLTLNWTVRGERRSESWCAISNRTRLPGRSSKRGR